jgi:hypothetical protein
MHRVFVPASKFKEMMHSERQDSVWRIVKEHLTPDEQLRISMIFAFAPDLSSVSLALRSHVGSPPKPSANIIEEL